MSTPKILSVQGLDPTWEVPAQPSRNSSDYENMLEATPSASSTRPLFGAQLAKRIQSFRKRNTNIGLPQGRSESQQQGPEDACVQRSSCLSVCTVNEVGTKSPNVGGGQTRGGSCNKVSSIETDHAMKPDEDPSPTMAGQLLRKRRPSESQGASPSGRGRHQGDHDLAGELFLYAVDGVWRSFLLLRVVRVWYARTRRELDYKKQGKLVARRWADRRQDQLFRLWREQALATRRRRQGLARMRRRTKERNLELLRHIYDAFSVYSKRRRFLTDAACFLRAVRRGKECRSAFEEWRDLAAAVRFCELRKFQSAISRWRVFAQDEAQWSRVRIKARQLSVRVQTRYVLEFWRQAMGVARVRREKCEGLLRVRDAKRVSLMAWTAWQSARIEIYHRWLRPRRHYVRKLMAKILFVLKFRVIRREKLLTIADEVVVRLRERRLRAALPCWHLNIRRRVDWGASVADKSRRFAREQRRPNLLRRTLRSWRERVVRLRHFESQLDLHGRENVLRPVFRALTSQFLPQSKAESSAALLKASQFFLNRRFRTAFFHGWRAGARLSRRDHRRLRRALAFWYQTLLGRCFRKGWRVFTERKRAKRIREAQALSLFRDQTRKIAVRSLLSAIVQRAEAEREALRDCFENLYEEKERVARNSADAFLARSKRRSKTKIKARGGTIISSANTFTLLDLDDLQLLQAAELRRRTSLIL
ncbi:unnamed protein product [Amoebophrya sp. A25]|nr:unnamed protein product [Amoebophrya sp. A25]|eukprot:GSA25T00016193001.1